MSATWTDRIRKVLPDKVWRVRLWWPPEWWRRVALVVLYLLLPLVLIDWLLPPPLYRADVVSGVVLDRRGAVMRRRWPRRRTAWN